MCAASATSSAFAAPVTWFRDGGVRNPLDAAPRHAESSGFVDTILFSNEMNMSSHLDRKMQYDFYINIVRKRKRFSPWLRKEKIDDLEHIKRYDGYRNEKAQIALTLLTKEQLEFIRSKNDMGGKG